MPEFAAPEKSPRGPRARPDITPAPRPAASPGLAQSLGDVPPTSVPRSNVDFSRVRVHVDSAPDARTEAVRELGTPAGNRGIPWLLASDTIQAKLAVGSVGDRYEQEADRAAEEVMRRPEPGPIGAGGSSRMRRIPESADGRHANALEGPGQPLPSEDRDYMESRFGYRFDAVRIHAGPAAHRTATALEARAFTLGHRVVFAEGHSGHGTTAGRTLLAHELAHVVQQGTARTSWAPGGMLSPAPRLVQRWEGLEHRTIGNRAQAEFPFRGTLETDMTALRVTPRKDPDEPHRNTRADLLSGATVLVLGKERGWMQVVVESGRAKDGQGKTLSAEGMTGYISHELITRSSGTFDAELPLSGGLDLTYGDLVAFGGDHFKNFAEISGEATSAAGRARLRKLQNLTENEPTLQPAYEDAATISKEYAERYKNLALENVSHFAGGGTALITWQQLHRQAVVDALEAGRQGNIAALTRAYATNAFADHYLTDSFSAGHIRVPREQVTIFYKKLADEVFQHIIDHISERLGSRIFELLQNDSRMVRYFGDAEDRQAAITRVRTQVVASIAAAGGMANVQEQFGLYVGGAVSKIMHDRENRMGLDVVSKQHPEGWTAYGDAKLEDPGNAKNLRYVLEAVQASKQDVLAAFRIGADVLTKHGRTPSQSAVDASMEELATKVGPPYAALDFVPSPAPGAPALPSWEWGELDSSMKAGLLALISQYLTTRVQADLLAQLPERQEVEIENAPDVVARPRDAARDVLQQFLADPIPFLEQAFGRPAGR